MSVRFFEGLRKLNEKGGFMERIKKKNREATMRMPRFYFFFTGAFFSSFLTGFFATIITSGFNI